MQFFDTEPKNTKPVNRDTQSATGDLHLPTLIHEQHAVYTNHPAVELYPNSHLRDNMRQSPSDDQPWEVVPNIDDAIHARVLATPRVSSLLSGASPPLHSLPLPRSPSPYNVVNNKQEYGNQPLQMQPEERPPSSNDGHRERDKEAAEKKEERRIWSTIKDKLSWSKEKDQRDDVELTRMIGYLVATGLEDWMVVLEVCDRASSNETNAKEVVRALRREFKYGEPAAQLSAARLWAIMSRNCGGAFVAEIFNRKFISTVEEQITSSRTFPVVRDRLLDVVADAAYNSSKDSAFRNLWRRVKPADKPEEGIPFQSDDEIINPPVANLRRSQIEINAPPGTSSIPLPSNTLNPSLRQHSPARRIISLEEDIQRMFQECHIGIGNAALLSEALVFCQPEELNTNPAIREFYLKCRASQELINSQIPWASAGAEHSRMSQSRTSQPLRPTNDSPSEDDETIEERLLGELLKTNEELQFVLEQYSDFERVAFERHAENLILQASKMEVRFSQYQDPEGWRSSTYSSRSPSPSIRSDIDAQHSDLVEPADKPEEGILFESDDEMTSKRPDELFLEILGRVPDQDFLKAFLGLLVGRCSISSGDSLNKDDAMLMDISTDELEERLHEMHSILRFESSIAVYHPSFVDFLQVSSRSSQYHVNRSAGTRQYLELMTKLLIRHARSTNHGNDHFAPEFGKLIKRNPQAIGLDVEDWEQTLRPLLNALDKLLIPLNVNSLLDGYCQQCQFFQITYDTLIHFKSLRKREDPVVEKYLNSLEEIILYGNTGYQNFEINFRPVVFGLTAIVGILMAILAHQR